MKSRVVKRAKSSADPEVTTPFTASDFTELSLNEHGRYFSNSEQVGHAVILRDVDGESIALQYALPQTTDPGTPAVCQLTDIEEIERDKIRYHRATGPNGKRWYARRYDHASIQVDSKASLVDIAYFSEGEEDSERELFCRNEHEVPRCREDVSDDIKQKAFASRMTKGGDEMEVDPDSVVYRDTHHDRLVSQNKIMGDGVQEKSARDAYEDFFRDMESVLSDDMKRLLQRAFKANIKQSPENQHRPEWLHAYGFSLTPRDQNPQHKHNLGAAGKWANTEMMVLERIAKWFALHENASTRITIKTLFDMLAQSELIDKIHFEVNIEFKNRFIRFVQDLDAFKMSPVFRKASDLAQATGISYSILHAHSPIFNEKIKRIIQTESLLDLEAARRFKPVPETFPAVAVASASCIATIIDLETTGLDSNRDKIIEMGMLSFAFTPSGEIIEITEQYNGLNDPGSPLPEKIIALTKITNEDLRGQKIDWDTVLRILENTNYIICHNSGFDRKFLESQTPDDIQCKIRLMPFGCTRQDINWKAKGYKNAKLHDLNQALGFTYDGHRAINDCWATFNLLREVKDSLAELMRNVNRSVTLLCATGAPYEKREQLKRRHFMWSDGSKSLLPKCWYTYVQDDDLDETKAWLDDVIYMKKGKSHDIPQKPSITAIDRYSVRAERVSQHNKSNARLFSSQSETGHDDIERVSRPRRYLSIKMSPQL